MSRKKTIEYGTPIIRKDNKHMAKCGERSYVYCRKYRFVDENCRLCVFCRKRVHKKKADAMDYNTIIECKRCHEMKPSSEFYRTRRMFEDKYGITRRYTSVNYVCKKCWIETIGKIANEKRKLKTAKNKKKNEENN